MGVAVGIVGRDGRRMLDFYGSFLGLEKVETRNVGIGSMHVYRCGSTRIKLLLLEEPPAAANPAGRHRDATGFRYLSFEVHDLAAILDSVATVGGSTLLPVTAAGDKFFAFVSDPDGNAIELIQTASELQPITSISGRA